MIGWHGTDRDFDAFDEAMFGSNEERSPNGRLGVWVFLREGLAEGLGLRILEVEADVPPERIFRIPNKDMLKDHMVAKRLDDPHGIYERKRADLLAQGYQAIEVAEIDGACHMAVILDLACITSVRDLSAAPAMR